ncbi:MAG: response regulator [Deltaproteobacteria bacterium]|nr:response regulator [Deltaproteobacteria bacterium]
MIDAGIMARQRVLVVEDDPAMAQLEAQVLEEAGLEARVVHGLQAATHALQSYAPDLVVLDYRLPDGNALELLDRLSAALSHLPVVVVTAADEVQLAVELMKRGVKDYLVKDGRTIDLLPEIARRVLEQTRLRRELDRARAEKGCLEERLAAAEARYRAQVENSQRLEAIGRLAGGIAHDFNNLLMSVLASAQLLQSRLPPGPDHEDLDVIVSATQRATSLTRQLLMFGRRQRMALAPVGVNEVVLDLMQLIQRTIGEDILITLRLDAKVPPIQADVGQLEQVLLNLCINARDAMPEGGKLVISTREASLAAEEVRENPEAQAGPHVVLTVADTGSGIAEESLAHIFEPYFSTKEPGARGTGLGLATVHGIVHQHRGIIRVESSSGQGTSFLVFLPASSQPARPRRPTPAPAPAPLPPGQGTVLVVEDEAPLRQVIERVLSESGYRLVVAPNGAEALRLFEKSPEAFDVALIDAVMPLMGGRQLLAEIRKVRPHLPVVLMSGYEESHDLQAGLDDYVLFAAKPIGADELCARVRTALRRRRPVTP